MTVSIKHSDQQDQVVAQGGVHPLPDPCNAAGRPNTPGSLQAALSTLFGADAPVAQRLEALLRGTDCIKGAFVILEQSTGRIVFCNANACTLLDKSEPVAPIANASDFIDLVARSNRAITVGEIREALLPSKPTDRVTDPIELLLCDAPFELMHRHLDIPGAGWFTSFSLRDITLRKSLETAQSDLISVVSHELRSPLASIRGSLQLLNSGALGALPEDARKVFEIAMRNSEHMLSVVNEILEDESQKRKNALKTDVIDLSQLVRDGIDAQAGFAAQWGTQLHESGTLPGCFTIGNRQKLLQVLTNLITNAVKFSPEKSAITVSIQDRGADWRVAVADQGPGVPAEQRPVLFTRFSSMQVQTESKLDSSGLGLSIAKEIIDAHGGDIDFRDEQPSGTTFFFDLKKANQSQG